MLNSKHVRMRINQSETVTCSCCGEKANKSLMMFDLKLGKNVLHICDICNHTLFLKTLDASNKVDAKLKDAHDIAIINKRAERVERV